MNGRPCNRPPEPQGRALVPIQAAASYRVRCAWCGRTLTHDPARPILRDPGARPLAGFYCHHPEGAP